MFCCHSVEVEQRNAHLLFSAELRYVLRAQPTRARRRFMGAVG